MGDRKEQSDDDILQCRKDVLRARDIIPGTAKRDEGRLDNPPPYKEEANRQPKTESEKTTPSTPTVNESSGKNKPAPKEPTETETGPAAEQETTEIPQFNLAEEILAEQRKITAIRRKAPGVQKEPKLEALKAQPSGHATERSAGTEPEQNSIITEIVARDIERLCRSENLADKGAF